jgi:DNA-binding transcriptional regulator YiaG
MGKIYYSEALEAVHQSAKDLFEIGAITENDMKEFDEACFVSEPETSPAVPKTAATGNAELRLPPPLGRTVL